MTGVSKRKPGIVEGDGNLVRPRFSPGLLLEDEDLTLTVDYMRNMTRLLFRSLFGCGVLCGFKVEVAENCKVLCLRICKGVALNCTGDPIEVPEKQTLTLDLSCLPPFPPEKTLWVLVRRGEKQCVQRDVLCAHDDSDAGAVSTRVRDQFVLEIAETPEGTCHAPRADDEGACACDCCGEKVVLALIHTIKKDPATEIVTAQVDHGVRRFVRPSLVTDPIKPNPPPPTPAP